MFGLVLVGGSFAANLMLMASCCCFALCVGPTATAIHRLRGAQRILATVVMNVVVLVLLAATSAPHLLTATKQIILDCALAWWDVLCWL